MPAAFRLETGSFVLYMLVAFPIFPEPDAAHFTPSYCTGTKRVVMLLHNLQCAHAPRGV